MFLHIGKNVIININDILAILDIESMKKSKDFEKFYETLELEDISNTNENKKTLVLVKERERWKGYISNISSTTLAKREILSKNKN